jgi:transposase
MGGADDAGQVADAFDAMARSSPTNNARWRQAKSGLEAAVAARTAELEAANAALAAERQTAAAASLRTSARAAHAR